MLFSLPPFPRDVKASVALGEGGHAVSEAVVRRRFQSSSINFNDLYKELVDAWAIYDNSGRKPILISEGCTP